MTTSLCFTCNSGISKIQIHNQLFQKHSGLNLKRQRSSTKWYPTFLGAIPAILVVAQWPPPRKWHDRLNPCQVIYHQSERSLQGVQQFSLNVSLWVCKNYIRLSRWLLALSFTWGLVGLWNIGLNDFAFCPKCQSQSILFKECLYERVL